MERSLMSFPLPNKNIIALPYYMYIHILHIDIYIHILHKYIHIIHTYIYRYIYIRVYTYICVYMPIIPRYLILYPHIIYPDISTLGGGVRCIGMHPQVRVLQMQTSVGIDGWIDS